MKPLLFTSTSFGPENSENVTVYDLDRKFSVNEFCPLLEI